MKSASLALAAALVLNLSGCGADDPSAPATTPPTSLVSSLPVGTVEGRLLAVGGPAGTADNVLSGRLTIKGTDGSVVHADIGTDGRFAIQLSPGDYRLSATSPSYSSGKAACRPDPPVTTLVAGQTVQVDVLCQRD